MPEYYFYIAELISKHLSNTINEEEVGKLNEWREASPRNEKLFRKICDRENMARHELERIKFNKLQGWDEVNKRIQSSIHRKYIIKVITYAAFIIVPLFTGLLLFTITNKDTEYIAQQPSVSILPGDKKAILTLDNGEVIDLENIKNKEISEKDGTAISVDETTLNYQSATKKKETEEIYNKVEIPHGGEYALLLSDGTKVHLNAMSSLRFPVHFTGNTRQVELEGEAYFEVAKKEEPFIVKINDMQVEVLGTTFNISAYPEESYQTTLVNGAVKVRALDTQASYILNPSEQAVFTSQTDEVMIRKVDVSLYTSWVQGKIYFKDQRLEDIMKSLSRWYDMEVIYENEKVKNLRFGCNVDRYKDITPFLELLEKTGKVKITKKGKQIIIK